MSTSGLDGTIARLALSWQHVEERIMHLDLEVNDSREDARTPSEFFSNSSDRGSFCRSTPESRLEDLLCFQE